MLSAKANALLQANCKRRWSLNVKPSIDGFSGASQYGRFDRDIDFWRNGLSEPAQVRLVSQDRGLNFRLFSDKDYSFFHGAVTGSLQSVIWHESAGAEDEDSDTERQ